MFSEPLHPAVVHFPIVLAFLLPAVTLVGLVLLKRGVAVRPAWSAVLAVAILLFISSWLSVRTGESQEERVEEMVPEAPLESHEESAERFLVLSGVGLVLVIIGFAPGAVGRGARVLAVPASLGLAAMVASIGHSGGELVYRHGAAEAYGGGSGSSTDGAEWGGEKEDEDEDEDEAEGADDD